MVGTSVVYPLIVQILTLTSSLLIYSVSVLIVLIHTVICYWFTVGWAQIEDITVDLPLDVTVLPQNYTLHAIKTGDVKNFEYAEWYFKSNSSKIEFCSGQGFVESYNCSIGEGISVDEDNGKYDFTLTITWDGEGIIDEDLNQEISYSDHVYSFHLKFGEAPRNRSYVITGEYSALRACYNFLLVPESAPSSLTVVNKTANTITISWAALDSSDADGYVVNVTTDTDTVQIVQVEGSSNNTITLNGLKIETTYNITVRAYQQLLGPASSTINVTTNYYCQTEGMLHVVHY